MDFFSDMTPAELLKLQRIRRQVRFILWLEKTAQAVLPAVLLIGAYVLTGLLGWPQKLPDTGRLIVLLILAGTCGFLLYKGLRRQTPPSEQHINTRIEEASHLAHHPLETLQDQPAPGMSPLLWQAHIQRTRSQLVKLRTGWPRLASHPRHNAHPSVILLASLCIAALANGAAFPQMILSAFWPGMDTPYMPLPTLQAWVTPQDYTNQAPLFLDPMRKDFSANAASVITLTVSGSQTAPTLDFSKQGLTHISLKNQGQKSWEIKGELAQSGLLVIHVRGRTLARWQAHITAYPQPSISWSKPPETNKTNGRIKLSYKAGQTYGLRRIEVVFTPSTAHPYDSRKSLTRILPFDGTPKQIETSADIDVTQDLWAGDKVAAHLVVTDVNGHTAQSKDEDLTLPVKHFHNPLANSLQRLRKDFYTQKKKRTDVAADLSALMQLPGRSAEDPEIIINFASLAEFVKNARLPLAQIRTETFERLWQLALDLDAGRTTDRENLLASQELEAARKSVAEQLEKMNRLGKAGQSEANKAELEKRLARLRAAIQNKMAALFHQAQREHANMPPMINMDMIGKGLLSDQLQQLQKLAESGKTAEALKHLQDMADSTKTMRNATPQDLMALGAQMAMQQQLQEQQALLHDMVTRQSQLLDATQNRKNHSLTYLPPTSEQMDNDQALATLSPDELVKHFQNQQQTHPLPLHEDENKTDPPPPDPLAQERRHDRKLQHALARALTELQHEYKDLGGKPPEGFAKAHTAMKNAQTSLAKSDDLQTFIAQTDALKNLQQGQQQMQQSMQKQGHGASASILLPLMSASKGAGSGAGTLPQPGVQEEGQKEDEDPLGRKLGKGKATTRDSSDTNLSDTISPNQSRAIQEELRKRDSDRTRPKQELDYLGRLLNSFE